VLVRAFVGLAGVVVAAALAKVVLVAQLDALEALDFVAVVFELLIDAVAGAVTGDRLGGLDGCLLLWEIGERQR